jgi:uncharacterized protein
MKTILTLLIVGLVIGLIANIFFFNTKSDFSRVKIGEGDWNVETVSSLNDRAKGLSDRESLDKNAGMLFIFPEPGFHGIWMKDMNFAIDIIWLDKNLHIVDFREGVTPESFPDVFRSGKFALYVLEINAGEARGAKIKIGDQAEIFSNTP